MSPGNATRSTAARSPSNGSGSVTGPTRTAARAALPLVTTLHDDPPVGTVVLGHQQVIYLGNGEWQPLED